MATSSPRFQFARHREVGNQGDAVAHSHKALDGLNGRQFDGHIQGRSVALEGFNDPAPQRRGHVVGNEQLRTKIVNGNAVRCAPADGRGSRSASGCLHRRRWCGTAAGSGRKETMPISNVRRFSSSGMREASMRCTVTLICGYSRRNASMAGSRYMQVYSLAARCRLSAFEALQLAERAGRFAPQGHQAQRIIAQQDSGRGQRAVAGGPVEQDLPHIRRACESTWLTAGWVRCRRAAAREKLRSSATARKVSSWQSSMRSSGARVISRRRLFSN